MNTIDSTKEFHIAFGLPVHDQPNTEDLTLALRRIGFMLEELSEMSAAFVARDRVGVLDALTDLQYFLDGMYLVFGMAHLKDAAYAEVHRSNMSKLGEDGRPVLRADGKIIKGPNFSPPDLAQFFEQEPQPQPEPKTP